MKKEIGKFAFFAIIAAVVIVLGGFIWRFTEAPGNKGTDEEATFREAERKAKANGIDLRNVPEWAGLYYKYHPEEKPPKGFEPEAPPVTAIPSAAAPVAPPLGQR